jgi:acyl-CoA reductase-like NAD-dependent aldehyde dehydrogenase
MVPKVKSGEWKVGGERVPRKHEQSQPRTAKAYRLPGALLNDVPKDDEVSSLDFFGSTLVIEATSKEEVLETLKNDPYGRADVWDFDKVGQILTSPPSLRAGADFAGANLPVPPGLEDISHRLSYSSKR